MISHLISRLHFIRRFILNFCCCYSSWESYYGYSGSVCGCVQNRLNQIEEVKREENIKVRQTASEDFHDEVGNSLTRIQVLTDVLHTKLGNGHEEEKRIIGMIKENVSGLYQGTRDILWALNPESDLIKEIGHRLESLGIDVFQDTGICFKYEN